MSGVLQELKANNTFRLFLPNQPLSSDFLRFLMTSSSPLLNLKSNLFLTKYDRHDTN